jgi:hypothetical protein
MKTVSAFCLLVACLALFSGCSSDPTSDDFKEFAEGYARQVEGDLKWKNGSTYKVTCKVPEIDLRKTDSLTNPYVGSAMFDIDIANVILHSSTIPNGKTDAIYHNRVTLNFSWDGNNWVDKGGEGRITGISLPSIPKEERSNYAKFHSDTVGTLTAEESEKKNIILLNNYIDP